MSAVGSLRRAISVVAIAVCGVAGCRIGRGLLSGAGAGAEFGCGEGRFGLVAAGGLFGHHCEAFAVGAGLDANGLSAKDDASVLFCPSRDLLIRRGACSCIGMVTVAESVSLKTYGLVHEALIFPRVFVHEVQGVAGELDAAGHLALAEESISAIWGGSLPSVRVVVIGCLYILQISQITSPEIFSVDILWRMLVVFALWRILILIVNGGAKYRVKLPPSYYIPPGVAVE